MIVECDKCHTRYDVEDEVIQPNGRKLRCLQCGHIFFRKPTIRQSFTSMASMLDDLEKVLLDTEEFTTAITEKNFNIPSD